jgi:DNA-binding NarL/FixJ family response regulator
VPNEDAVVRLLGREVECHALEVLLGHVRAGRSQVLVVRGEAGVGKTALLDFLAVCSSDLWVVRASGVEAEMELAFSGLHQLLAPLLDRLSTLPPPQYDALTVALGLRRGEPPAKFLVALAVLTLVADAAAAKPIVAIVDDAQWLDTVSAQTLGFVARRLLAEPVAMVFATRTHDMPSSLERLPELTVAGLNPDAARTLLGRAVTGRLDERVRDQILAETAGNPLAIMELTQGLTHSQLAGGYRMPDSRPLSRQIESSFLRHLEQLPTGARHLLLLTAAEPTGNPDLLRRAASRRGVEQSAESACESTGLIRFDSRVRFRHPLVRSSIYTSATPEERRQAHQALADVTDPVVDPDRRAWHRANATAFPDEAVAADLERSAERARQRGGAAAAAAFLEHAVRLTPEPHVRCARALAAAHAKFEAADPDAARDLLASTEMGAPTDAQRALVLRLRAQISFTHRRGRDAPALLLDAARALETHDLDLARETYLDAFAAACVAGPLGEVQLRDLAEAAKGVVVGHALSRPIDLLLDALSTLVADGAREGLAKLDNAVRAFRDEQLTTHDEVIRWLGLACPLAEEFAVHQLWDFEAWHELAARAVSLARDSGALTFLPVALAYLAGVQIHRGEFAAAAATLEGANEVTEMTGLVPVSYATLVLSAWRGDEAATVDLVNATLGDALQRGEGLVQVVAGVVTAVLHNGLGNYEAAMAAATSSSSFDGLSFSGWALVELVEAASRCGDRREALDALERLEARTSLTGTDWGQGMLARSRALVSETADAEDLYVEAIQLLMRSGVSIHLARARLVYGEWLRREGRRNDARRELRTAHDMFSRFGATAYEARSRKELLATGETLRTRTSSASGVVLTAQETHIASLAAAGLTNSEIGSHLFISPRTVEYHLAKVYSQLGIGSRRDLNRALTRLEGSASATSPMMTNDGGYPSQAGDR